MIAGKKYAPTLRAKKGELGSVSVLPLKFSDNLLPIFVIPPKWEMKDGQPRLLDVPAALNFSDVLLPYWRGRPVIIDPAHVFEALGEESCETWLPQAFSRARGKGLYAIPCALISELKGLKQKAFKLALDKHAEIKLALRLYSDDVEDSEVLRELLDVVSGLGIKPSDCIVLVDFTDADLSLSEAPDVVIRTLDDLCQLGAWGGLVVQGSSYPIKYPVGENESCTIPRHEFKLWEKIHDDVQNLSSPVIFGDFAADHSQMNFPKSKGGGKPFTSLRYTSRDTWFVIRGDQKGRVADEIIKIATKICELKYFSGAEFSPADKWIKTAASGGGSTGNPSQWRQHNTTRHIMITLKALFDLSGDHFDSTSVPIKEHEQVSLFDGLS